MGILSSHTAMNWSSLSSYSKGEKIMKIGGEPQIIVVSLGFHILGNSYYKKSEPHENRSIKRWWMVDISSHRMG